MNLGTLVANLPTKNGAVYTFERGKRARHSFTSLADDVAAAAAKLRDWGVVAATRVGIYAPNSYHWLVQDLALIGIGAVSVPFTDDFSGKIDRALLDKYQIALLLVAKSGPQPLCGKQPYVAYLDADNDGEVRAIERSLSAADDGVLTLVFSSGSAGGLKGLVITREGVEATLSPVCDAIGVKDDDRILLFLPMSNFQQRTMCYAALWYDFDIIITNYLELPGSIKQLQPSILIAPPMYFQMIYTRFVNFPDAKRGLWTILGTLLGLIPVAPLRRMLAENLFHEFYQQFGGKMRVLITGMAPIKREVAQYFALMQLPLCESYGLVETGSLTYRPPSSKKYGSVGKLLEGVNIELSPDGEIIVLRRQSLTDRYFQSADGENDRTFLGPGRIATGDVGTLDRDGYLYLQGRKRELIITAGGYKIHPEIVEAELAGCPDIGQAAVFLKPGSASLTAVAALNRPESKEAQDRVRDFVRGMKTTKAAQIGEVIFAEAAFTADNGMLRPNLKLDRRAIAAKYQLV